MGGKTTGNRNNRRGKVGHSGKFKHQMKLDAERDVRKAKPGIKEPGETVSELLNRRRPQ